MVITRTDNRRWSILGIAAATVAAGWLAPVGRGDPPAPSPSMTSDDWRPRSNEHLWRTLLIAPVEGLTTDWHVAPQQTAIPLGSLLTFKYKASADAVFEWRGAYEVLREGATSFAVCPAVQQGPQLVELDITVGNLHYAASCAIDVVNISPRSISVSPVTVDLDPMQIDTTLPPGQLNPITMQHYFGDSIAAIRPIGPGMYLTSIGRDIPVAAIVSPPAFAPLVEWRINGYAAALGTTASMRIGVPGAHVVSVGPPAGATSIHVQTYAVTLSSDLSTDMIPEGEPVTFTATTAPAGYEDDVTWVASTKFGTGVPVIGRGPVFTTRFDDTFGQLPDGTWFQWLGVKGDNYAYGQDQKPNCVQFEVEAMNEAVGRPDFDSFPNGALLFDPVIVASFGTNGPCPAPPVSAGGGITNSRYTVNGNNLQQVSNNIFDLATGQGPLLKGRRFAGSATLSMSPDVSFTVVDGNLCVQITSITWTTKILLPNWTPPKGTPPAQIAEWNRFRMALNTHEKGHAAINDAHMPMVRDRLVNQAAGKTTVPGTGIPTYDPETGEPVTPADAARNDQIMNAAYALIAANPALATLETAQTNYDNPPSPTNPTGTDHGRTQGATLNTNP